MAVEPDEETELAAGRYLDIVRRVKRSHPSYAPDFWVSGRMYGPVADIMKDIPRQPKKKRRWYERK